MFKKIILAFLLALLFSNVLFIDASNVSIGDGGDNYEFMGFMYLTKQNILNGEAPFAYTNIFRYPHGFEYNHGADGFLPIVVGALFSLFLEPVISYNITVVAILFLNVLSCLVFFEKLAELNDTNSNKEVKVVLASVIFGLSPYVFARLNSHLNLATVVGFPALMYYLAFMNNNIVQRSQNIKIREFLFIVFSIVLVGLGSLQYLILLFLTVPIILLYVVIRKNMANYIWFIKRYIKEIIISTALLVSMFIMVWWGFVTAALSRTLVLQGRESKYIMPAVTDIVMPNQYIGEHWQFLNSSESSIEKVITVGTIELLILGFILVSTKDKRDKTFLLAVFTFYLIAAFGLLKLPLYPEGGRLVVVVSLLISLYLVGKTDTMKNRNILYLFLMLVLAERLFFNIQTSSIPSASALEQEIDHLTGEAVLNVPLSKYNPIRSALPAIYNKKIIDGYFHFTASSKETEQVFEEIYFWRFICENERLDDLADVYSFNEIDEAHQAYKEKDIAAVAIFKDGKAGKFLFPECENVRNWWYYINPETIVLSKATGELEKTTAHLKDYNPNTLTRIYFERSGKLTVNGLFITPDTIEDVVVTLPNGETLSPEFTKQNQGLSTEFDPQLEIEGKAGDSIFIESKNKLEGNRYVNIYYKFEPNREDLSKIPPPFEIIYSDHDVEIYKVNFD